MYLGEIFHDRSTEFVVLLGPSKGSHQRSSKGKSLAPRQQLSNRLSRDHSRHSNGDGGRQSLKLVLSRSNQGQVSFLEKELDIIF